MNENILHTIRAEIYGDDFHHQTGNDEIRRFGQDLAWALEEDLSVEDALRDEE